MRQLACHTDVDELQRRGASAHTEKHPAASAERPLWELSEPRWRAIAYMHEEVPAPPLRANAPARADELPHEGARIQEAGEAPVASASVCMLGQGGVGKSTRLETIVASSQVVLPQGGSGTPTAQAITVHYAYTPSLAPSTTLRSTRKGRPPETSNCLDGFRPHLGQASRHDDGEAVTVLVPGHGGGKPSIEGQTVVRSLMPGQQARLAGAWLRAAVTEH